MKTNLVNPPDRLVSADLELKQQDSDQFYVSNHGGTLKGLRCAFFAISADGDIRTQANDNSKVYLYAPDTGVGLVEVARLQGAADPYLQATLGIVLAPMAQPAVPVEGRLIYNAATNKLNFWNGAGWEVVTSV